MTDLVPVPDGDALPALSGLEERARSYARDSRAQRRRERGRAESVTETAPLAS